MEKNQNDKQQVTPEQQDQILFMMLVQQHQHIALMGLGEMENPASGKKKRDLASAKYAIDTLAMLEKYTAGNISKELVNFLTEMLGRLRLKYVNAKKNGDSGQ